VHVFWLQILSVKTRLHPASLSTSALFHHRFFPQRPSFSSPSHDHRPVRVARRHILPPPPGCCPPAPPASSPRFPPPTTTTLPATSLRLLTVNSAAMSERYIPEHRRTQFKAKNTFKPEELRRRREEQQVEIRKQKREENLAKRRGIGTGADRPGASLGAAPDSDDENPPTESQVCVFSCASTSPTLGLARPPPLSPSSQRCLLRVSPHFLPRCLF
jgi:hypothetical protein